MSSMKTTLLNASRLILGDRLSFAIRHSIARRTPEMIEADKARDRFYANFIRKDDLCFDVGANLGNRVASLLAAGARVVAIEPNSDANWSCAIALGKRSPSCPRDCPISREPRPCSCPTRIPCPPSPRNGSTP